MNAPDNNLFLISSRNIIYDSIDNKVYIPQAYENSFFVYNSENGIDNFLSNNLHPFNNSMDEYFIVFSNGSESTEGPGSETGNLLIECGSEETNGASITVMVMSINNKNEPEPNVNIEVSINRVFKDKDLNTIEVDNDKTILKIGKFDSIVFKSEVIDEIYETDDNALFLTKIYDKSRDINFLYPNMNDSTNMSTSFRMNSVVKKTKQKGTYKLLTKNKGGLRININDKPSMVLNTATDDMGKLYLEYIPPSFNVTEQYVTIKVRNLTTNATVYKTFKILPFQDIESYKDQPIYPTDENCFNLEVIPVEITENKSIKTLHFPHSLANLNYLAILPANEFVDLYNNTSYSLLLDKSIKYSIYSIDFSIDNQKILNSKYNITIYSKDLHQGMYFCVYLVQSRQNAEDSITYFI